MLGTKYLFPNKDIVALSTKMICEDMKKTSLKLAVETLVCEMNEVFVDESIMRRSRRSLDRMFELMG